MPWIEFSIAGVTVMGVSLPPIATQEIQVKQNKTFLNLATTILLAMGLGVSICSCSGKNDTQAIYELIQKGSRLAEEKQVGGLMDLTLPEFVAQPGSHNRQEAKGVLFAAFMHYGKFRIHYPRPEVGLLPDRAGARATIHFLIVRQDQSIPGLKELYDNPRKWIEKAGEKADLYQLELVLRKEEGDWLVSDAELEGFKGTGF